MTQTGIDWEAVYREYEFKVRSYIRSRVGNPENVDDLCSEVFLNVMRGRDSFSGEPKAVSSWIYIITKRTVAMFYRNHRQGYEIPAAMGMSYPNMKILHKKALNQMKKKFL